MTKRSSTTPLYKKLGITNDSNILVLNSPKSYIDFFSDFPVNVNIHITENRRQFEFIHVFVQTTEELEMFFKIAKKSLNNKGLLWISWPKKTSKIVSELDKFMILKYGLANGLVDTKVVSVDENWSGHKFVVRLCDRG
ncbi:MAG: DUF3052 domain-containing protein [Flavobacteriaceae bacterium]|nr:MAG: DUF3052 domain-containing protein [Flavobacteriaceae bacterium]